MTRSQLGYDLNLDGYNDTEHISFDGDVVYRNPYLGIRLMDEEIALATLLTATGAVGSRRRSGAVSLGTRLPGSPHWPRDQ